MPDWQAFGLDGDVLWTVLVVGLLLVAVLAVVRYAGYFDKNDDFAE